jgi:hypothetical protein
VSVQMIEAPRLSRGEISKMLGGQPGKKALIFATRFYGVCIAVIAVLSLGFGKGGFFVAAFLTLIPVLMAPVYFGTIMGALINGGRYYTPAIDAVASGEINCTYALRGSICKGGVLIVDDGQRRLWLNGEVLGFDDVKSVGWRSVNREHALNITLRKGASPVTSLHFDTQQQAENACGRLSNTLGFS